MIRRKFAAIALGLALATGATGCTFNSPVASLDMYVPSDGAQIDVGDLKVRNFIYLTDSAGYAALFGSVVNSSSRSQVLEIQYTDAASGAKSSSTVLIEGGQKVDLGYNGNSPLEIALAGQPGSLTSVFVVQVNGEGKELKIPVLDGTLAEYADLLPAN